MASRLACTMADDVALLATVAGLDDPPDCDPSRPVPVLAVQGTADRFLPYDGGVGTGPAGLPLSAETSAGLIGVVTRRGPAPETAAAWAERNGCDAQPADEDLGGGATVAAWEGCDDGADGRAGHHRGRRAHLARQHHHGRPGAAARPGVRRGGGQRPHLGPLRGHRPLTV